jgi:hypothetical protein
MIYFRNIGYMGRLGNQMFQLAAAIGIAKEREFEAGIPIENCTRQVGNGPIDVKTGLPMNVKCDLVDCFNIPSKYLLPMSEINPQYIYHEEDFKFNPQVLSLNPNTDLYGYFQNEKYFKKYRGEILEVFTFKEKYETEAKSFLTEKIGSGMVDKSIVSLHVRRGDYTLYPQYHPVCSDDYYQSAIGKFDLQNSLFLVFSDDIEWCKKKFEGDNFMFSDTNDPYLDLAIMSMCDHHIIANSSFSWWGAWLNRSEDKKVIAPSRWFGEALNKDSSDVYCEGWEVI